MTFFDAIRPTFGGKLTQKQVDGLSFLLRATAGVQSVQHRAYILATAFWETARTMQPIAEYGRGKGRPYGVIDQTGKAPYGRGYVQLTWRDNYIRADKELGLGGRLAADYGLALDPKIAADILVRGMLEGWFTGKKLADYSTYRDMRRVVNGTDRASEIAKIAEAFERALAAGIPAPQPETLLDKLIAWLRNLWRQL